MARAATLRVVRESCQVVVDMWEVRRSFFPFPPVVGVAVLNFSFFPVRELRSVPLCGRPAEGAGICRARGRLSVPCTAGNDVCILTQLARCLWYKIHTQLLQESLGKTLIINVSCAAEGMR